MCRIGIVVGLGVVLVGCVYVQDMVLLDVVEVLIFVIFVVCDSELFYQFDFWVGDWIVMVGVGQFVGINLISVEENGCLLLEKWMFVNGGMGQSYNFYNLVIDKWCQVWVSQGVMIDYEGGLIDMGLMKLIGMIIYFVSVLIVDFIGEWMLNVDGMVIQYFEQYDVEKDEWVVWFIGQYMCCDDEVMVIN